MTLDASCPKCGCRALASVSYNGEIIYTACTKRLECGFEGKKSVSPEVAESLRNIKEIDNILDLCK